jgi:hypothetical protein
MRIRFWLFMLLAITHFAAYLCLDAWLYLNFPGDRGSALLWNFARLLGAPLTHPVADLEFGVNLAPVYNSLLWGFGLERGAALWRARHRSVVVTEEEEDESYAGRGPSARG